MCEWDCSGKCYSNCEKTCASDCEDTCSGGCSGSCSGCTSCTGTCKNTCTSCSGCSGCSGTCNNTCTGSCTGKCNTACTAEAQAELIANLGQNIAVGKVIRASDYTQLKAAIDQEYTRRGKTAPPGFAKSPAAKEPVLLSVSQKVLTDVYEFDKDAAHDWRSSFEAGKVVPPSKWQPVIAHIKTLMSDIV